MSSNYGWIHLGTQKQISTYYTLKPQYSPHKHRPIDYGATQKIVQPTDTSPPLNRKGNKESPKYRGSFNLCGESSQQQTPRILEHNNRPKISSNQGNCSGN